MAFAAARSVRWPVWATDALLIPLALASAFLLHFDFVVPAGGWRPLVQLLPLLLASRLLTFALAGQYRSQWQHVGLHDLLVLTAHAALGTVVFVTALAVLDAFSVVPRSVIALEFLLTMAYGSAARVTARTRWERRLGDAPREEWRRTLIIGAGGTAEYAIRQFRHDRRARLQVVGLVDDDPRLAGTSLHGVPVLGTIEDLGRLVIRDAVALLVIAIPSATGEQMRRIVERCNDTGVTLKILPSLRDLLEGRAPASQLRDVQIEDLLGRAPATLDLTPVQRDLAGKVVLVTGGAGSIGSELARQIARFGPKRLILFEQAESPLYFVHLELAKAYPELDLVPIVGDVVNLARLEQVFEQHRPHFVFHAAAYKHVPMMEDNVGEAVRNNVIGTFRVADCAARHGAERFVLISTDKAVRPTSIMGCTKRVAERLVLAIPSSLETATDFRAVRFGNVLGSDGSVVPVFKRQLAAGGPLTVTHPEITRYFMTIPEAVQLVLAAAVLPNAAGRICMLEMGEPMKILTLAETLIRLSGLEPYRDIQIQFSGLRPGEKMYEELSSDLETTLPTELEKIRIVQTDCMVGLSVAEGLDRLARALENADEESIVAVLEAMVPDFTRKDGRHAAPTGEVEVAVPVQSETQKARLPRADIALAGDSPRVAATASA
jgi:FlaA1/EpsC-like NDP-sugar epimerase